MNPSVLIFRADLLPPSETFVAAQAHALRRYSPVFTGLRRIRTGLELDSEECVTVTRTDTLAEKIHRRIFLHSGHAPQFLRRIRQHGPVLLHAHFAVDAAAALPLAQELKLPLVVTLHGYDVTSTDDALRRTEPGRVYLRRRSKLFAAASAFLCVSEHIREQAQARGFPEAKLRTHRIGVDLNLFAPDACCSRSRDPIVLFVGRLVAKKGCYHLLRAMQGVVQRHPSAKLLIVGDGPLLDSLRAQAHVMLHCCTFLGAQPPAVVRDLMHRASVLAAPSVVAADGDSEGLPIVLCEALAMGLPIAGFEGPGVSEAVVSCESALLAPSGDDAALSDCISAILTDGDLSARLGAGGRRCAEQRFSLAAQTAELEAIYDTILQ